MPIEKPKSSLLGESLLNPYQTFRITNFAEEARVQSKKVGTPKEPAPASNQPRDEFSLDTGQRLYIKSLIG